MSSSVGNGGAEFTGDLAANYFAGVLSDPFARQLQRLLGRIAVLTRPADEADPAAYRAPIEAGWILVQWGSGQR